MASIDTPQKPTPPTPPTPRPAPAPQTPPTQQAPQPPPLLRRVFARHGLVAALLVGYVLQVAWRLWLAQAAVAPTAHADEDGYLLAARVLAGGAGGYSTENGPFRRLGFPLLLVPAYWPGHEAFTVYRRVVVLVSLLNALVYPLAVLFARRVLGLPRWWALAGGFTVAAAPAVVYYSGMAMTDSVLPPLVLGWLVLVCGWVTASGRARWWYALGSGAVAGVFWAVHVRGTMVLAVHALLVVGLVASRRVRVPVAAASVASATVLAGTDLAAKAVIGPAIVSLGDSPGPQLPTALTVDWGVAMVVLRCTGQLWYLGIGTLGLGLVGVVAVVRLIPAAARALAAARRRARTRNDPEASLQVTGAQLVTLLAALAVSCLVALGSATSLSFGDRRINYFAYPRYLHFMYPVWFLVGLWVLRSLTGRARLRAGIAGAGALGITAAVTGWRIAQATGYQFVAFDAPEAMALSGRWDRLQILAPTLAVLGLLAVLVVTQYRRWAAPAGLAVVLGLCVAGMPVIERHVISPMVSYQYPAGTPRIVRDLHLSRRDVVAEAWQVPFPFLFNHAREVSWHRLLTFDAAGPPPERATVVIAPWYGDGQVSSWDGTRYQMRQVAVDPVHGWAVWRVRD